MHTHGPIAIMSAMQDELQAVLDELPDAKVHHVAGRDFWRAHWNGHVVIAVLSRIGKVAAATTTTVLANHFGVRAVLFTGVAGGLGPHVKVGDMVVGTHFMQHDMDASPIFPRHQLPLYGTDRFAADGGLRDCLLRAAHATVLDLGECIHADAKAEFKLDNVHVHPGLIISGDRFVSTTVECRSLQTELPEALAVDMECAAVAQVCHDFGLPFGAVRSVSDRADDGAHGDFTRFVEEVASHYSVNVMAKALQMLPHA